MSGAPVVPLARARAHVLGKQGLAGEGLATMVDAVVATAGVYGTAPTCYLSCVARVRDFRLTALDEELYAKRSVVRLRCVRGMAYIEPMDPAVARAELTRRYLRAYGPATTDDLKWWTGWTRRDTIAALAALDEEICPVSLDDVPAWVLASELDALRDGDPEAGRGVRLLPVWDAYFMGYAASPAGRARQVAAGDYGRIYDRSGNGTSTVTVDGVAAGVWQLDPDAGTVAVASFSGALADRWAEVQAQVARLALAIGTDLRSERAAERLPLSSGPRNAFLSPITLGRPAGSP